MSAGNDGGPSAAARERKRARFDGSEGPSNRKLSGLLVAGVGIAILAASAFLLSKGGDTSRSLERAAHAPAPAPATPAGASAAAAVPISPDGDAFRIPSSSVTTEATFFRAAAGATTVPFFAVRDAAGRVHVALDACQVCARAKKGYLQQGDRMQCRNCGMTFPVAGITEMGGEGGCHPIALPATASGDAVVVKVADVAAGAKWF
jgi:hypothetical protein